MYCISFRFAVDITVGLPLAGVLYCLHSLMHFVLGFGQCKLCRVLLL